ncbi:MAG TPA: phospholipid carrier-dependent glycosyltransferase, partial [Elusimicrobiota bacterium]|nr:phospholipid carrier-dependent glycosyltransferase [Elusimicrobiota bacterium]
WGRLYDIGVVTGCLLYFSYWILDGLWTQGVYCDIGFLGRYALGVTHGLPVDSGDAFLRFFGRSFSLTLRPQHGPNEIYLTLPWIYLLGNTAAALHLSPFFWSALSLPLFYGIARRLYQSRVSATAGLILFAASTSHIAAVRLGLYSGSILLFWALAALGAFLKWRTTRRTPWRMAGFFFLGIGSGCRCFFWWYVAAIAVVFGTVERKSWRARVLATGAFWGSLGVFLVGVLPIVVANLTGKFYMFRFFLQNMLYTSETRPVMNLAYATNLGKRLIHLKSLLNGTFFSRPDAPDLALPILFGTALIGVGLYAALSKDAHKKRFVLPAALIVLVFLQTPFSPTSLDPHHLLILFPFICLTAASVFAFSLPKTLKFPLWLVGGFLVAWSGYNGYVRVHHREAHRQLHGGSDVKWNTLGRVVAWCRDKDLRTLGLADTGLMDSFIYLSGGDIRIKEVFAAAYRSPDLDGQREEFRNYLRRDASGYYLFRGKGQNPWVPFFNDFLRIVREEGRDARLAMTFVDPDGIEAYAVYHVASKKTP